MRGRYRNVDNDTRAMTMTGVLGVLGLIAAGCGGDGAGPAATGGPAADRPVIVATTTIWADVTRNVVCGDIAEVTSVIPAGADAHQYEPSLQDRGLLGDAAIIVANGLDLEMALGATIDSVEADGAAVFRVAEHIDDPIEYGDDGHDHHDDHDNDHEHNEDDHSDDHGHDGDDDGHGHDHEHDGDDHHDDHDHGDDHHDDGDDGDDGDDHHDDGDDHHDDHGHDHDGDDPHVWFDPVRVAEVLPALGEAIADATGLDAAAIDECVADYRTQLVELDGEITESLSALTHDERVLVTSHESLGYFADRYDLRVIGTVIAGTSSMAETNPADLDDLATAVRNAGVPTVFADAENSLRDIEALADRAGVEVVVIGTESLGEPGTDTDTYIGFMRSNADLIASGLGSR